MIKNKKQMFLVIVSFILVMILGVVSYAFFNYTRTGSTNTVSVGRLNFTSTQNNTINLSNVFPTDSTHLDNSNSGTVTINIIGDTNYSEGIEYKVSIVDVDNVVNNKEVGMGFTTTATNLGTQSNDYYNDRGSTTNVYNLVESGVVENDKLIFVGYIKPDQNGVNGSVNITAYIDKERVGISDTISTVVNDNLVYGETDGEWIVGREIFTTNEWNSLSTDGVSFKVKVEANEGIWVNEPQYIVLQNLNGIQEWKNIRANISSIEFSIDSEVPNNAITSFDATDLTSVGPVIVYTLDDGLNNNTYKAVICADDVIYAPLDSSNLFLGLTKMMIFDSENFRIDNVKNAYRMFTGCGRNVGLSLVNVLDWNTSNIEDMSYMLSMTGISNMDFAINWDISNVTDMRYMFRQCRNLTNLNGLIDWDTSNVTNMSSMFYECDNLTNINGLINWNTSNIESIAEMFRDTKIENVDALINWNTSSVEDMSYLFCNCTSLVNINGLKKWNTSNVENMRDMFNNCNSLTNINGLKNWNTANVTNMVGMLHDCSSTDIDISNFDMSNVTNDISMFEYAGFQTLAMPNNYTIIGDFMFNHNINYIGEAFTIPKSVTFIGTSHVFYDFGTDELFKRFIVEDGSTSFKTIDDILYTYDGTRLISVPRGKTFVNNKFEIPEGVTFLNELSFSRNQNIDTVVLPNSYVIERFIYAQNNNYGFINTGNSLSVAIYRYTSIKEYEVKNNNPSYLSYNGCIYSKDGTELIAVPVHYNGVLNIKSGTTTIGQEAFWTISDTSSVDGLTQINIPASVTIIETNQLTTLNALMSRSTNPVTITIDSGNTSYQITNNQIVAR